MVINECLCTVLMISYNHAKYIKDALESVLNQKTKYKYKIKIFDDCSKDGTQDIIKEYASKYPELIAAYINDKNMGAQENIWRAYASVDTKYCILLECDDYWCDTKKLELQITALEKHPECSFCGHNTRLITLNEQCREYEEGTLCCRNEILNRQKIFEYKDFFPVDDGGYIPYVSARLVRTASFNLDKITYKESFLFDHTQFYYLLLKGKYYYINRPMSVYRRTGTGTCSEENPLVFLNTFVQNSLDFNRETNFIIAEKIFKDCELQMDFRRILYHKTETHKLEGLAKDGYINFCSCVALGDTYIWASLKSSIEAEYQAPIHFIIKPQYEIVMKMFGIENYTLYDGFDSIEWDKIKKSLRPQKGKLFLGHPTFYEEYYLMYEALRNRRITIDFVSYLKKFVGISSKATLDTPIWYPSLSDDFYKKLKDFPLEKIVLFSVEANTCSEYGIDFWENKAKNLVQKGYKVVINSIKEFKCDYAENWHLSLNDAMALSAKCHAVYALRSGFCDVISLYCPKLKVFYNEFADMHIFSIKKMFGLETDIEEEILFQDDIKSYLNKNVSINGQKKLPLLFGVIRIPDKVYAFYHKNRKWFKNKRIINLFIKWM